jgi:hypothetical protein
MVFLAAPARLACADEEQYIPWEKGSIALGGLVAVFDTTLTFGQNNAPGVSINAEDRLGLASTLAVFKAQATYRPGLSQRNQVDLAYSSYHRSGEATLSEDLTIDGITYPIGAHVETVFNFDLIRGGYSYALIQNDRLRLGLGFGIYIVPLKYGLEITTASGRSAVDGADVVLPLPALALRTEFQVLPRLYLNAGIDAMYLEISGFRGSLLDVNAGIEYRPWKHLGLGVGYTFTGMSVNAERSDSSYPGADFVGSVEVQFSGLSFYGKFSF